MVLQSLDDDALSAIHGKVLLCDLPALACVCKRWQHSMTNSMAWGRCNSPALRKSCARSGAILRSELANGGAGATLRPMLLKRIFVDDDVGDDRMTIPLCVTGDAVVSRVNQMMMRLQELGRVQQQRDPSRASAMVALRLSDVVTEFELRARRYTAILERIDMVLSWHGNLDGSTTLQVLLNAYQHVWLPAIRAATRPLTNETVSSSVAERIVVLEGVISQLATTFRHYAPLLLLHADHFAVVFGRAARGPPPTGNNGTATVGRSGLWPPSRILLSLMLRRRRRPNHDSSLREGQNHHHHAGRHAAISSEQSSREMVQILQEAASELPCWHWLLLDVVRCAIHCVHRLPRPPFFIRGRGAPRRTHTHTHMQNMLSRILAAHVSRLATTGAPRQLGGDAQGVAGAGAD